MSLARQFDAYRAWREHLDHQVVRLRDWLRDADLLDAQAEQQLRRIRGRLAEDKLVVAFVAEFSRGKSELINALFFADRGGRVLPSAAGRTTMCPTEISWEPGQSPGITLLPIETRAEGTSIAELRGAPEAWQTFPFDPAAPESMASALRRVGDVKNMPAEAARGLGFAVGDSADGSLVADDEGLVEVPRWRHAMIRFPHPLLEQGLVVLDTPGLNAIGAEPELTLSLLPGAHAVLFVLAADTGVTQSDLAIWRDHVGNCPGRLVVLNKIDGLWDGLRPDWEIEAEIARQARSCAQILDLPTNRIFAVSAQKGLVAKVNGDTGLLARSKLPRLEDALATELLPAKRDIVAGGTVVEAMRLAAETKQLLATRHAAIVAQIGELTGLRGKHESVIAHTVTKVGAEKEAFERGLREYYAVPQRFLAALGNAVRASWAGKAARPFTPGTRGHGARDLHPATDRRHERPVFGRAHQPEIFGEKHHRDCRHDARHAPEVRRPTRLCAGTATAVLAARQSRAARQAGRGFSAALWQPAQPADARQAHPQPAVL
ncbi:MAG: dynamin family protein [Rhodocyclaceae bacterium]|nr:dynamin family protein [Rhodocyclaceae bacterium]